MWLKEKRFEFEVGNQDILLRIILFELFRKLPFNKDNQSHLSKYH